MAIWNFWKAKNQKQQVVNPDYDRRPTGIKQGAGRRDYTQYMQDIENYRYITSPDDVIDKLSRTDSDMSNAVHNFLIALDSGIHFIAVDDRDVQLSRGTLRLKTILDRTKGKSIDKSIKTIIRQIARLLLCRGAFGVEVVTDSLGRLKEFAVIDPKWVDWYKENGEFVAYQNNIKVSSDFLFWGFVDPDVDSVQHISPLLSALSIIFFRIGVLQDLEKVVKRAGWRRLSVKLIEEIMVRNAPASVKRNAEQLRGWLEARRKEVEDIYTNIQPDHALVYWDSSEPDYLDASSNSSIDVKPLMDVLDQQISSGLKTLPSILGRGSDVGDVENVLYVRGVKYFQEIIKNCMDNVLSFVLQLEGVKAYSNLKFNEVDLRSPNEIENHKLMKQKRLLELACIGFVELSEVCFELTGHELPKGFEKKWFEAYRLSHLGLSIGTSDDDDSDNGNYNQEVEEQKPGGDSIDIRTDDEKVDKNIKTKIRIVGGEK